MIRNAVTPLIAARRCLHVVNPLIQPSSSFATVEGAPAPKRSAIPPRDHGQPRKPYNPKAHPNAKPYSNRKDYSKLDEFEGKRRYDYHAPEKKYKKKKVIDPDRLLRPFDLSQHLRNLCKEDRIDDAVQKLKTTPLDAQNVAVWSTLIKLVIDAKRYQLAYELFVDMKRRGFSPNLRSFSTLFSGYAQIEDWSKFSKQLDNLHSLFGEYLEFAKSLDPSDPQVMQYRNHPLNMYIHILGAAKLHQKIFDVYFSLDVDGPLTPDNYTYTTMFNALFERKESPVPDVDVSTQNALDARVLWRRLLKDSEKFNFPVDSHIIIGLLKVLSRGRPTDYILAFDIIRDYLGLVKPGETPIEPKVKLTPFLFQTVLELCNYSKKHRLCIHWAQQIMDRSSDENAPPTMLTRTNMEQVFHAYASLSAMGSLNEGEQALEVLNWMVKQYVVNPELGQALKPSLHTYGLVMMACWRGGDWSSASRIFELITGLSAKSFLDGEDRPLTRLYSKGLQPNCVISACLVRAAIRSRDRVNMRQCLRMLSHFGEENMYSMGVLPLDASQKHVKRLQKDHYYYVGILANSLIDCVSAVFRGEHSGKADEDRGKNPMTKAEGDSWAELRKKAKAVMRGQTTYAYVPVLEEQPLGSVKGLAAANSRVDFELMSRHSGGANRRTSS